MVVSYEFSVVGKGWDQEIGPTRDIAVFRFSPEGQERLRSVWLSHRHTSFR